MVFKNRLYELRGTDSQATFAKKLGLTQQNYANYENGKQGLRSDLIRKVCQMYSCTAEWLLMFDDNLNIIGNNNTVNSHNQTTMTIDKHVNLSHDEKELVEGYGKLSLLNKSKLIIFLNELLEEVN